MSAVAVELTRLERGLARITMSTNEWLEVPQKLHSYETDAGGAPELHPELVRFIGQICSCGRQGVCAVGCRWSRDSSAKHLPDCDPGCPTERMHTSRHHPDRHRLKRALRQLRAIAPAEFDAVNLIVTRKLSPEAARQQINAGRNARSQPSYSPQDFLILMIAGTDKLIAAF